MKKKKILALAVLLSVLEGNSCWAAPSFIQDLILTEGTYTEFLDVHNKSIFVNEDFNNKGEVFNFNKGASIVVERRSYEDYHLNPVSNNTEHSLTINVGGALEQEGKKYDFYLKREKFKLAVNMPGAGIAICGKNSQNSINLTNTNMTIDLSDTDDCGIYVGREIHEHGATSALRIDAANSDINIINYYSDLNSIENSSSKGICVSNYGDLSIIGSGDANISISGNMIAGIDLKDGSNLKIDGINDLHIDLDRTDSTGIEFEGANADINLKGNLIIENSKSDSWIRGGIGNLETYGSNLISKLKLNVAGDVIIKDAALGICGNVDEREGRPDIVDLNITSNNIFVEAHKNDKYIDSGVALYTSGQEYREGASNYNITANGNNGINLDAEKIGYFAKGNTRSKLIANKGSININSAEFGVVLLAKDKFGKAIDVFMDGDKGINIHGDSVGVETVAVAGKLELQSNNGDVMITSDKYALKHGSKFREGHSELAFIDLSGETTTKITADKNVYISGKDTGIQYATVNNGKAEIVSNKGNAYVLGANGIYMDSQHFEDLPVYADKGNLGKHNISVKANKGSVFIGCWDAATKYGNGIFNSGRNILEVNGADLVAVQGYDTALNVRKETTNSIKGKDIVFNSNGVGIKSEGVNDVTIGYTENDNNVTNSIIVSGNIGIDMNANNLGKYDITSKLPYYNSLDNRIDAENNTMNIKANNIEVSGDEYGLNVSQDATAKGSDDKADILKVWKNNILNINADGLMKITAQNGTAINVDGINKISLKNTGDNFVSGKVCGINLNLSSNLVADKTNDYYAKEVQNHISNKIKEDIVSSHPVYWQYWDKTCGEIANEHLTNYLAKPYGCETLEELYSKMFNDKQFQEDNYITPEMLEKMDEFGDPAKELLLFMYSDQYTKEYLDSVFEKQYGQVLTDEKLAEAGCKTIYEYFDKLVIAGKFESVNQNIDVQDNFSLKTNGQNTVLGGANAFNVDGKLTALVKGDVNYFKSSNYRSENLGNATDGSIVVRVVNNGNFKAEGNKNILEAGKIDANGFGNETAINVADGGKADFVAEKGGNRLSGSVLVDNVGSLNIISNGGNNTILSSAYGVTGNEHVVNAVSASGKDSIVNINSGTSGINFISTNAKFNSTNSLDREITVLAQNNASINVNGAVSIKASNNANYVNAAKGNSLGIAVFAGDKVMESNGSALKPVDNISKVDINYTSDVKTSYIIGDIGAGYGGLVNIHQDKSKNNILNVEGNILASNGGVTNVDFGNGGYWSGRADDYYGADSKGNVDFFAPAFSNVVKENGKVNVSMQNGMWNVTGQSWLTSLEGDNNTIDMVNYNAAENSKNSTNAVSIQSLKGENNKFIMSLNNNDRYNSDMLYIKDGNTAFDVEVSGTIDGLAKVSQKNGLRFATVGKDIKLQGITYEEGGKAFVRGKDGGFFTTKLYVERQDYEKGNEYNDDFNGKELDASKPGTENVESFFGDTLADADNLVIVKVEGDGMTDAGNTVLDLSKVNYSNAVYMDRFNKRMGEERFIDGDEGLWVRMRHDRIRKDNAFRSSNTMYEIGYDAKQLKEDGEHRVGFVMDYMDGNSSFSKVNGSGEVNRKGLWMYDSWIGDKGHYRDFVAKWGHLTNDFEFMSGAGEATGEFSNNVYSVSAEFGKKNDIGNSWYFEPQAQLQYAHVTGSDYVTTMNGVDQTKIRNDAFNSLIARAGFRIGKDMDATSTVYIKADVMHEFLGEYDVFANDGTTSGEWAKASYDHGGTWYDLGFGYSTKLNEASYVYIDVETFLGNDFEKTYQINGGVQWSF